MGMARTWLSISVDLLGGRGEELWPSPGRLFAVGPSHTFMDFASAINTAFARWDHSHLSEFNLTDGRLIAYPEFALDALGSFNGPVMRLLDIDRQKVARTVKPGEEFKFVFDLGDSWVHRCTVGTKKIDPLETLGIVPAQPLPYWGWGVIPDQYDRNWDGDDGESEAPKKHPGVDPMLDYTWPPAVGPLDVSEVKAAIAAKDRTRFLDAITGRDINVALHEVAEGGALLLGKGGTEETAAIAVSFINRLTMRSAPGDKEIADQLLAALHTR